MVKKILLGLLVVFVVIQFIQPEKNVNKAVQVNHIATKYTVPDTIENLLSVACYDCHSNNTKYPWYNNIQPVAWWLASHVNDGKKHLNFDEFTKYSLKRQDHKLEEVIESQTDHWMPLDSYTWIHKEAKLADAQSKLIIDWANETRLKIQSDPGFATSPKK